MRAYNVCVMPMLFFVGCLNICPPATPYPHTQITVNPVTPPTALSDGSAVAANGARLIKLSASGVQLASAQSGSGAPFGEPFVASDNSVLAATINNFARYDANLQKLWEVTSETYIRVEFSADGGAYYARETHMQPTDFGRWYKFIRVAPDGSEAWSKDLQFSYYATSFRTDELSRAYTIEADNQVRLYDLDGTELADFSSGLTYEPRVFGARDGRALVGDNDRVLLFDDSGQQLMVVSDDSQYSLVGAELLSAGRVLVVKYRVDMGPAEDETRIEVYEPGGALIVSRSFGPTYQWSAQDDWLILPQWRYVGKISVTAKVLSLPDLTSRFTAELSLSIEDRPQCVGDTYTTYDQTYSGRGSIVDGRVYLSGDAALHVFDLTGGKQGVVNSTSQDTVEHTEPPIDYDPGWC